jgi:hypothetical protein
VRRHYRLTDSRSATSCTITEIEFDAGPAHDRTTYLFEDANGDRLLLSSTRDYLNQTTEVEIVDVATKELVRAAVTHPWESATRAETLAEIRRDPAVGAAWDAPIGIELNGVLVQAKASEWMARGMRDRRSSLRRAAGSPFLDRLERLRAFSGATSPLRLFCDHLLRYLLLNEACTSAVAQAYADPDCRFDAAFRYTCSDQQRQWIARRLAEGERVPAY